jgi:hypothetical protein
MVDAGGCMLESSVWVEAASGLSNAYPAKAELLAHLNLWPVPSSGPVVLHWSGGRNLDGILRVFAADGRERYRKATVLSPGSSMELDFSSWAPGSYWWSWSSPEGTISKPLVLSGR